MKFMIALAVGLSFALTSFAAETKDAKRDVAQSRGFKIKLHSGTATAHKLMDEEPTYLISIYGDAAKTVWNSLKSTKAVNMGNSSAAGVDKWTQKVATNITCDRIYDAEEKTSQYSCSLSIIDGVAQGGAAG